MEILIYKGKNKEEYFVKKKNMEVYQYIVDYVTATSVFPTIREICQNTNLSSTSSVYNQLATLTCKGLIRKIGDNKKDRYCLVGYSAVKNDMLSPLKITRLNNGFVGVKAKDVYEYIVKCVTENGFFPTTREICKAVGIASTSNVHDYMYRLVEQGYIKEIDSHYHTKYSLVGYEVRKDCDFFILFE